MTSDITLSASSGETTVELRISSALTLRVQAFITELKRWVDYSRVSTRSFSRLTQGSRTSDPFSFSWTAYYPVNPPKLELSSDEGEESVEELVGSSPMDDPRPGLIKSASCTSMRHASLTAAASIQTITPASAATTIPINQNDEEYPNPFAEGFSRTAFLRKRLHERQDKWSTRSQIK